MQRWHFLFHELVDGSLQVRDGLQVSLLHGVHDAMVDVILEDDLAGVGQGGADGG